MKQVGHTALLVHEWAGILLALGNVTLTTGSRQITQAFDTRHFPLSTKAPGEPNAFSKVINRFTKNFLKMYRKQMPSTQAFRYGTICQKIYLNRSLSKKKLGNLVQTLEQ